MTEVGAELLRTAPQRLGRCAAPLGVQCGHRAEHQVDQRDQQHDHEAMADLVQDTLLVKVAQWVASMPIATPAVKLSSTPSVAQQADQPVTRQEVPVTDEMKWTCRFNTARRLA